jgi:hypothetical protein
MAGASLGSASVGSASPDPAPTPAPAVVSVVSVDTEQAPTSDDVVDRSRPGARRPLPPAPEPAPAAAGEEAEEVDRSRPGARRPAVVAPPSAAPATAHAGPAAAAPAAAPRPAVLPSAPASSWVDASATAAAPASLGHGFGGGASAAFGSAPAGHGAVPNSFGSDGLATMHAGAYTPARSWKRPTAIALVAALVLGGAAAVAIPRYRDSQAQATAAQAPDVLVRSAPRALAGQKKLTVPGLVQMQQRLVSGGATWAWAQAYGSRDSVTLYVAADVPPSSRGDAVRALTSRDAATALLTEVSGGIVDGSKGQAVTGTPAEYASPVGGKTWCMPITVSGVAGGYCLWTSGKELLEVLSLPGLESVAAKSMMTSLTQMAASVTKAGPVSTLVPRPSAT